MIKRLLQVLAPGTDSEDTSQFERIPLAAAVLLL